MGYKFQIYQDRKGEWRARFCYLGMVLFSTEGFSTRQEAELAIEQAKKHIADAPVEEV